MPERGCATCCRRCARYDRAVAVVARNLAARAAGSLAADLKTGCPPRQTPCAEEPGGRHCWGPDCSACPGWRCPGG